MAYIMNKYERAETHTLDSMLGIRSTKGFGGERGIRTLGTVLGYTRFPVVRLRPAQPSLQLYFILFLPDYDGLTNRRREEENLLENIIFKG